MKLPSVRVRAAVVKPFLPVAFFFAGVTYDTITLTRIDRLIDNLIVLLYLSLLGFLIILTTRIQLGRNDLTGLSIGSWDASHLLDRGQPYYPMAIQFLLGGLFSAYTIFYSRSASLTTTAVFFAILVAFLVANEFLRDRLSSVQLLVCLYTLVTFSFFTFSLPVITGIMNTGIFLLGAVLTGAVSIGLVRQIYLGIEPRARWAPTLARLSAVGLVGVLVMFYFLNWIPPVPLALKFGGVYHKVDKIANQYYLTYEQAWYQFWKRSDDPFRKGRPAYCFTAVFAPVDLDTTIYHHWQYRPSTAPEGTDFSTTDRIGITISGGREEGYRGYTVKQEVAPGEWRVDVETKKGRIIGRVAFEVVEPTDGPSGLKTILY